MQCFSHGIFYPRKFSLKFIPFCCCNYVFLHTRCKAWLKRVRAFGIVVFFMGVGYGNKCKFNNIELKRNWEHLEISKSHFPSTIFVGFEIIH